MAQKRRYVAPQLRRRECLTRVTEGGGVRITARGVTVITPP